MRKQIPVFLCAFVIAALIGCGPSYRTKPPSDSSPKTYTIANAAYDISLISAEKSTGDKKMGAQRIEAVVEGGISKFSFEDETVRIKWLPSPYDIVFMLNNKTDGPVIIAWNKARFVDAKGVRQRLTHSGAGYEDRNNSHPPTVVAARGALEDFVHPADYFQREEGYGGSSDKEQGYWKRAPFLPAQIKGPAAQLRAKAEPFVGKTFQVILVLETGDIQNEYACHFKINKVTVAEEKHEQEKGPNNKEKGKRSGKGTRF